MKNSQKNDCWFFVNHHKPNREFEAVEKKAASCFLDFIKDKEYGKGVCLYRFDIYVESPVNFSRQADSFYNNHVYLSMHVAESAFHNATDKERLLLNAALILVKYLAERVPLPKGFRAEALVSDYENYLIAHSLLMPEEEIARVFIKYFETTRFNFRITKTNEIDESKVRFDLNRIEEFINNKIAGESFGTSINTIDFGFELYDFNGAFADFLKTTQNYKRYGTKYKNYLVVKHFNYAQLKNLNSEEQYSIIKANILEGINDFDTLTRKPKDFDIKRFYETMSKVLIEYEMNALTNELI